MLVMVWTFACALPSEEEANKTRCASSADCPPPLICFDQQCAKPAQPGKDAGAAETDAGALRTSCSSDSDCTASEICRNGLCRLECGADSDCSAEEVCVGGECADREVSACPSERCEGAQTCYQGLCSTEGITCTDGEIPDGCPDDAICLFFGEETPRCRTFSRCGPGVSCPRGPLGSSCSETLRPDKVPMCLPRICGTDQNCPVGAQCLELGGVKFCSDGSSGAPCRTDADCESSDCLDLIKTCR